MNALHPRGHDHTDAAPQSDSRFQPGDEPVPGYRVVTYLGRGGIGEVWKAEAPGKTEVALKVIDVSARHGRKEFRALQLIKNIRHPNLVPLHGLWLIDVDGRLCDDSRVLRVPPSDRRGGAASSTELSDVLREDRVVELVLAMGLCQESLFDRLRESRQAGRVGIPADQLLEYLDDAAQAIDWLNREHDVQHCDIKPQNILIVGASAQVCDFGLARMLGDLRRSSTHTYTVAYCAPELLGDGEPSTATDQYSLAITYYELRSGRLPFFKQSVSAVLRAKRGGRLDLSHIPPPEAAVIRQATALEPADRFETCAELIAALRAARQTSGDHVRETITPIPTTSLADALRYLLLPLVGAIFVILAILALSILSCQGG